MKVEVRGMKKTFNRRVGKAISILNYIKKVVTKLFKILVQSAVICFPVILTLVIINSLLGVHVRFNYYLILAIFSSLAMAILLCVLKFESIFAKPVKKSKRTVPAKTDRKTQRVVQRKRRKIS